MAKEIRIQITADSKDFIQGLNKVDDASLYSQKTLSQLNREHAKYSVQLKQGLDVSAKVNKLFDQTIFKIDRTEKSYQSFNEALKAHEKLQQKLVSMAQYQIENGADDKILETLFERIEAEQKLIDKIKEEKREQESANKALAEENKIKQEALNKFTQSVSSASKLQEEHDVMVALGNQAGLLQEKYKYLEIQLRESIKTTGVSSEKTKEIGRAHV